MLVKKGKHTIKEKIKSIHMRWWQKIVLIFIVAVLSGVLFEMIYQFNIQRKIEKNGYECAIESISQSDVQVELGIREGEKYILEPEGGISITFPERYINKLQYRYEADTNIEIVLYVEKQDVYGNYSVETVHDLSRTNLPQSVVNLQGIVKSIRIQIPAKTVIYNLEVNNAVDKNGYRILYVAVMVAVISALFLFKKEIGEKVEYGFLIISLSVGMLLIALQPTQFFCWDEHIHFLNAYEFFESGQVKLPQNSWYQFYNLESFGTPPFASKEEKQMQIHYLNHSVQESGESWEKPGFSINQVGYLHMGFIMQIGKILSIPFYYTLLLGKMANLFLYVIVVFFAIHTIPIYKRLMSVVALMPTPMILATAFSYDVVLNAFFFLGTALLVREFYYPEKKSKARNLSMILFCFFVGSCVKAIYAPLILTILFLPKTKFGSDKKQKFWWAITLTGCAVLILSFLLPTLMGNMQADARGGNTNVGLQFGMILNHPFAYIKVFWNSFWQEFNEFILGKSSLAHLAFMGFYKHYILVSLIVMGVFFSEPRERMIESTKNSMKIYKIVSSVLVIGILVLIWTSMYLAFSEVGATYISGVQGRYLIPLFIPAFIICYTDKVNSRWKNSNYNQIILLMIVWMWNMSLYKDYLCMFCN